MSQVIDVGSVLEMPNGRRYRLMKVGKTHVEYMTTKGNEIAQRVVSIVTFERMVRGAALLTARAKDKMED